MTEQEYKAIDDIPAGDELDARVNAIVKSPVVQFQPSRNWTDAMWAAESCNLFRPVHAEDLHADTFSREQAYLIQWCGWAVLLWGESVTLTCRIGEPAGKPYNWRQTISMSESGPLAISRAILKLRSPECQS